MLLVMSVLRLLNKQAQSIKNKLGFSLLWIGIYVILLSVGDNISEKIGIEKLITVPICIVLVLILCIWIHKQDLRELYGLCKFQGSIKNYLFFIPLILLASTNLWGGFRLNLSVTETVLYIVSMLCVGFLEELIFRGFLFQALCQENLTRAIIISSVTFGIGHIVNLFNGSNIPETLLQICYATAIGFLFTIIFYKSKSLLPCILTHGVINSLSVFANADATTMPMDIAISVFICIVSVGYALYILKKIKKAEE